MFGSVGASQSVLVMNDPVTALHPTRTRINTHGQYATNARHTVNCVLAPLAPGFYYAAAQPSRSEKSFASAIATLNATSFPASLESEAVAPCPQDATALMALPFRGSASARDRPSSPTTSTATNPTTDVCMFTNSCTPPAEIVRFATGCEPPAQHSSALAPLTSDWQVLVSSPHVVALPRQVQLPPHGLWQSASVLHFTAGMFAGHLPPGYSYLPRGGGGGQSHPESHAARVHRPGGEDGSVWESQSVGIQKNTLFPPRHCSADQPLSQQCIAFHPAILSPTLVWSGWMVRAACVPAATRHRLDVRVSGRAAGRHGDLDGGERGQRRDVVVEEIGSLDGDEAISPDGEQADPAVVGPRVIGGVAAVREGPAARPPAAMAAGGVSEGRTGMASQAWPGGGNLLAGGVEVELVARLAGDVAARGVHRAGVEVGRAGLHAAVR
jgi:hypothetical protein